MPAAVHLKDVRKSFGTTDIIKGVSFSIEPGEFVVLVGPSGCGKSTLLRMIAGLEETSSGDILFDEDRVNDWKPAKRRVGMVFQSYALYPHMTVEQNIGFGLKLAKKSKEERTQRVEEALDILQLQDQRDRKPSQLSGGQRQRVAIGRSIVRRPNVFLFDEPLSNLDTALRVQMRMEIGRLHRRLKNTVVYVTHDQVEAMTLADRIVVLEAGVVRQIGRPMELYERPANMFVAGFIGSPKMGFLKTRRAQQASNSLSLQLQEDETRGPLNFGAEFDLSEITSDPIIGIRPEHTVPCAPEDGHAAGEVLELEKLGADTFAYVDLACADEPVGVRVQASDQVRPGEKIGVSFELDHVHMFRPSGERISRRNSESAGQQTAQEGAA